LAELDRVPEGWIVFENVDKTRENLSRTLTETFPVRINPRTRAQVPNRGRKDQDVGRFIRAVVLHVPIGSSYVSEIGYEPSHALETSIIKN
jgi:hypothetical protein